jgi:hypothetical protein
MKPSEALASNRAAIRHVVESHRARNARVFGSVLRGQDTDSSDLDILVDPTPETTLFDPMRDKPRRSGRGRIARTLLSSYNVSAAETQGGLRRDTPEVTPVERRAAVGHSAQEPTEKRLRSGIEPLLSAVGISGLRAGEGVKHQRP